MKIEAAVLSEMQITDYIVQQAFYSRRNEVYRINARCKDSSQIDFVYKKYISGDIENEYFNLKQMQGRKVPRILAKGESALCLEYIGGLLMLERFEEKEKHALSFHAEIDGLIDFLAEFYSVMPGYIYGDINLRNFIFTDKCVYGIDLEDVKKGVISADIGKTAAYLLTYAPAFTEYKKEIISYLICRSTERLHIAEKDILEEKYKEIENIKARRY